MSEELEARGNPSGGFVFLHPLSLIIARNQNVGQDGCYRSYDSPSDMLADPIVTAHMSHHCRSLSHPCRNSPHLTGV